MTRAMFSPILVALCVGLTAVVHANYVDNSAVPILQEYSLPAPITASSIKEISGSRIRLSGEAAVRDEGYVRITSMLPGKDGGLWFLEPYTGRGFEIAADFRVTGERFLGGDGFAIWYTQDKERRGSTFGSLDNFRGLGIFFDTYDNDGKRDNPSLSGYVFTGEQKYDADSDGEQTRLDGAFCRLSFRNARRPVHVKIAYHDIDHTLSVYYDIRGNGHFQQCFVAKDVTLPTHGYFGFTAHTGDVADNHDLHAFSVRSLDLGDQLIQAEVAEAKKVDESLGAGEVKTDDQRLTGLAKLVKDWNKLPFEERDRLIAERKDRLRKLRAEAEDEGEGEHDHEHEHDHDEEEGGEKAENAPKFERRVVKQLGRIQTMLTELFTEVEEVGKNVADVNFDINTNVIPLLGGKDKNAAAGSTPPSPASAPAPAPPTARSEGGGISDVDVERLESKLKEAGTTAVKEVATLVQGQTNQIKALSADIAEVKSIVKSRLATNQHDEEAASKLTLMTNEVTKLKAMVKSMYDDREATAEALKTHIEKLSSTMSTSNGTSMWTMLVFVVLQCGIMAGFLVYQRIQDSKKMHLL